MQHHRARSVAAARTLSFGLSVASVFVAGVPLRIRHRRCVRTRRGIGVSAAPLSDPRRTQEHAPFAAVATLVLRSSLRPGMSTHGLADRPRYQ